MSWLDDIDRDRMLGKKDLTRSLVEEFVQKYDGIISTNLDELAAKVWDQGKFQLAKGYDKEGGNNLFSDFCYKTADPTDRFEPKDYSYGHYVWRAINDNLNSGFTVFLYFQNNSRILGPFCRNTSSQSAFQYRETFLDAPTSSHRGFFIKARNFNEDTLRNLLKWYYLDGADQIGKSLDLPKKLGIE